MQNQYWRLILTIVTQVTADSTIMQQVADLGEETGHVCVICREGYKFQPTKVLGIYTFTKRCNVEEYEVKPRKTVGYSTVTHFNVVHVDCHMAAVRFVKKHCFESQIPIFLGNYSYFTKMY